MSHGRKHSGFRDALDDRNERVMRRRPRPEKMRKKLAAKLPLRALWEKAKGVCHLCGFPVPWVPRNIFGSRGGGVGPSRDHRIPISDGGCNNLSNIALAHLVCNARRHGRGVSDREIISMIREYVRRHRTEFYDTTVDPNRADWIYDLLMGAHEKIDVEYRRAGGDVMCKHCKEPYRKHPHAKEHLDYRNTPFLRRLCDGSLVKL